jgi:hypothetical protein
MGGFNSMSNRSLASVSARVLSATRSEMRKAATMGSGQGNQDYPYVDSHMATWGYFCTIAKWVAIGSVIVLILMAAFLTGSHRDITG